MEDAGGHHQPSAQGERSRLRERSGLPNEPQSFDPRRAVRRVQPGNRRVEGRSFIRHHEDRMPRLENALHAI